MTRIIKYSYQTAVYAFLYAPIIIIMIFSFNDTQRSTLWQGFTWHWYQQLIMDLDLLRAAGYSLIIGVLAATSAAILGTLTAVCLQRYRFAGRKLLKSLVFILIIVPDIILAVAFLMLYNSVSLPLGFWSLFLAHTSFCLPFVAVMVFSRLNSIDESLFEAAKDLGARDSTILRKVLVPLLAPAIVAGWLISFTLSIDDVMISFFVSGPTFQILPLKIFSMARTGVSPELNALCSIMFVITLLLILLAQRFIRQR
ncbi:MAG: spermidine/putrescine ABC transporter permease PotC [Pseudomonadota bacterium]|nr:spermidine/putrescine ABC transporter permease PotC [Pseudomonadota bacterium]